jgi:DNA-binding transcriptional LysR family regulator
MDRPSSSLSDTAEPFSGRSARRSRHWGLALARAGQELVRWNRRVRSIPLLAFAVSCALIGIAITIFPAVIVATFLGGLGPGLLATVLGAAGAWSFCSRIGQPSTATIGCCRFSCTSWWRASTAC